MTVWINHAKIISYQTYCYIKDTDYIKDIPNKVNI